MAKQVLPVNFTDDLLAESMDGKRKYRMIDNGDGTISLEDVSEYLQTGSTFGAGQINSTNQAVNESVDKDKILKTLEEVSASTDSDAVVGRGAVAELNQNIDNQLNYFQGEIVATSLENAVALICDRCNVVKHTYMGTFIYAGYPYTYKVVYISVGDWMGEIAKHTLGGSEPYAFVRSAGADAVLKKLGSGLTGIIGSVNKSNFDETKILQPGRYRYAFASNGSAPSYATALEIYVNGSKVAGWHAGDENSVGNGYYSGVQSGEFTIDKESSVRLYIWGPSSHGVGGLCKISD